MWLTMTAVIWWSVIPPGFSYTCCEIDDAREIHCRLLTGGDFTDSVIELDGVWGITVSMGNVDDDPELEIGLRVAKPTGSSYISRLVMLDHDLSELWTREIGDVGNVEVAGFSLADLDGDGRDEVVFPLSDVFFNTEPRYKARIYALNGETGEDLPGWPYILPGWPEDPYLRPYSEVVVADLNSDGQQEVLCEAVDINSIRKCGSAVYCFNANGDSLWKCWLYQDTVYRHGGFTKPAVADLDGDSTLEIICHEAMFYHQNPWYLIERRLFIINHDGTIRRSVQTEGQGSSFVPDYAAPTVADLNQDGNWEIIVLRRGGYLDVFDTALVRVSGFPIDLTADAGYLNPTFTRCFSTPAVADIDQDGDLEIIVGSFGLVASSSDWGGHIHVFHHNGTRVSGFPYETRNGVWYSSGAADVDTGRAGLEILTAACDSGFYIVTCSGESLPGWPKRHFPTYWLPDQGSHAFIEGKIPMSKTPQLGDIDADGLIEIMMTGADGRFYYWNTGAPLNSDRMPVPTYHFDQKRSGWYQRRVTGVQDRAGSQLRMGNATIVRDIFFLPASKTGSWQKAVMLDAGGRMVCELSAGANDVHNFAPGVYFVKAVSADLPAISRILIVR